MSHPKTFRQTCRLNHMERGQGKPLILIMGLGAPGTAWAEHLTAYEKKFRAIAVDNRGVGSSEQPPGPYRTAEMADDIAALMDRLGIESACVAGISMGGAIAQELALRHPTRVLRLLLVATWSRLDSYAKSVFEHMKSIHAVSSPPDFARLVQHWIYTPAYWNAHEQALLEAREKAFENAMAHQAFAGQCDACIEHDTFDRLLNIRCPTLVTAGDQDIFTPIRFSRQLAARIPHSRLRVFENCAHAHHWEALREFNSETTAFLESAQLE